MEKLEYKNEDVKVILHYNPSIFLQQVVCHSVFLENI